MPGQTEEATEIMKFIAGEVSKDTYVNIMEQYRVVQHNFTPEMGYLSLLGNFISLECTACFNNLLVVPKVFRKFTLPAWATWPNGPRTLRNHLQNLPYKFPHNTLGDWQVSQYATVTICILCVL